MSEASGWQPLQRPSSYQVPEPGAFELTPFARLARVHTITMLADGFVAVALAGSIFFSVSPDDARWRVALYLLLTVAPFAVVTPLIGPAIDRARGGRRGMIMLTTALRAVVAFLMVGQIDSLLLFPLAFGVLVLQKGYAVARAAMVPSLVGSEAELVEANSKLALLSAIGAMIGAVVGGVFVLLGGPELSMAVAALLFIGAFLFSFQLPHVVVAATPAADVEREELRSRGILLAASAMALLRAVVGFVTFLLAFEFRGGRDGLSFHLEGAAVGVASGVARGADVTGEPGAPAWHFGAVLLAAGVGTVVGARLAPELRKRQPEENILAAVLVGVVAAGLLASWGGGLLGAVAISLTVAVATAMGKLAFDSIVQRDAPDANHGRSFAGFEARFQLTWVIGAFIAVVSPIRSARFGYVIVTALAAFAAFSYLAGARAGREVSLAAWRRRLVVLSRNAAGRPPNPDTSPSRVRLPRPAWWPGSGSTADGPWSRTARRTEPPASAPESPEPAGSVVDDTPEDVAAPSAPDAAPPAEPAPTDRVEPAPTTWYEAAGPASPVVWSVDGVEVVDDVEPPPPGPPPAGRRPGHRGGPGT